jgi:hypothetical protein
MFNAKYDCEMAVKVNFDGFVGTPECCDYGWGRGDIYILGNPSWGQVKSVLMDHIRQTEITEVRDIKTQQVVSIPIGSAVYTVDGDEVDLIEDGEGGVIPKVWSKNCYVW